MIRVKERKMSLSKDDYKRLRGKIYPDRPSFQLLLRFYSLERG